MKKYLITIFLALTLNACSEGGSEGAANQNGQSFFWNSVEWIRGLFQSKSAEEVGRQKGESQALVVTKSAAAVAFENHLSQVAANLQSASQIQDQKIEKNELEQYRQDYAQAVDVKDKVEALIALVQVDRENAIPLLKKAYTSREPELRKEAVLQMHVFNDKKEVVNLLLKALDDSDPDVVMEAVEGLSGLENKRALKGLKKIAESHPDKLIREVALDYVKQAKTNVD
ncbi:MAG: HEAT repeat domain-containing protein [Methylomicrobium sp.]